MSVRVVGAKRVQYKIASLPEQYRQAFREEVKVSAINIETGAKRRVKVDRGRLRNGIAHEISGNGLTARIGTNVQYGPAVEFGRGAGKKGPPLKAIEAWVRRKGLAKGAKRGQKKREERAIAFLIARHIARHGIKAAPFLFPAFEEEVPHFRRRLRASLQAVHQRVAK